MNKEDALVTAEDTDIDVMPSPEQLPHDGGQLSAGQPACTKPPDTLKSSRLPSAVEWQRCHLHLNTAES